MSELRENNLSALRERVEKAEGPDRNLDIDVMRALVPAEQEKNYWFWQGSRPQGTPHKDPQTYWDKRQTPELTASIDAAVALIERKLPGRDIDIEIRPGMSNGKVHQSTDATIYGHAYGPDGDKSWKAYAFTPALALIAALLNALENTNG